MRQALGKVFWNYIRGNYNESINEQEELRGMYGRGLDTASFFGRCSLMSNGADKDPQHSHQHAQRGHFFRHGFDSLVASGGDQDAGVFLHSRLDHVENGC